MEVLTALFIFVCIFGQQFWGITIPSASSSYVHYATKYGENDNQIVFINHHWPDVGNTFASHLSCTLISHGLFIGTVETASVHIAIFSKDYAKSSCCLNELQIMLKSGAPIIPIFYDVRPSELRCRVIHTPVLHTFRWTTVKSGIQYCEDLRMSEEEKIFEPQACQKRGQSDSSKITEWSRALFHASEISGFERSAYGGDEGRLVHDVVKHALSIKRVRSIEERKIPIHYDVFLNHRGRDTKNTLASHLYYRLRHHELQVFFDKEEMQKGSRINSVLENAINVASIHIVIFSAGYALSEWCMDELLLMIESGSIIIPVFYNLNPTEMWSNPVDGTNGVYAEALRLLEEEKTFDPQNHQERPRYKSSTIEKWKQALMEVTGREGFKLETYDGDEGRLVDNIVREVIKRKVKDNEPKISREQCQMKNVSSSEWERYIVLDDSNAICRLSSY